ncbi:growth inhibitor PemK [Sphingomonas sp. Leaf17]|uniref:type II toxin-antitoxin system PemK/MazF family toxin n=1 Tax=Sphingomonas sp. Leaf17 TaxID=1735683 RepID=UPI0006F7F797|nr:type II toxin-antitoxin system PemK/MazF family toxin [Sphingomonas sp. Leaf17]KQM63345.1 growth inhibitor PemK [Sphingomonas sp. Leaf17]
MVKRGEIWLAALDPTIGREIQKTRPCLVVSPDDMNRHLRTVTVTPVTTGSRAAPFRVELTFQGNTGLVLADQMRTIDAARLVTRMGRSDAATMRAVLAVLREMFAD